MQTDSKLDYAINRSFELAGKQGLTMITVICDVETEETKILCDTTAMDKEHAIMALEMLVDGIRQAREQNGDRMPN